MKNGMKKIFLCAAVVISIQFLAGQNHIFAETTSTQVNLESSVNQTTNSSSTNQIKQLPEKDNVDLGKIWTIKLNKPVDASSVNSKTIEVIEKDTGNLFNVTLHVQSSDASQVNIIPVNNYAMGKEYSIVISKDLKSKDGSSLKGDVQMDFKTQELPTSADDVSASVMQFGSYALPDQVNAKLPDGTIEQWNVQWNNNSIDTSIVGTYTFTGKLQGTDVNVNLSLTVTPYQITSASNGTRSQSDIQIKHLNYLMASKANRDSVEDAAAKLNGNSETNTCVYFASESYRRVGLSISPADYVCNTHRFIDVLTGYSWKKDYNKDDLLPGDQCFTKNDSTGYPTHTYTFVKWVNDNDHTWAYIVDNQRSIFGDGFHKRDILIVDTDQFDKFQFFMYKPN